MTKIPHRFQRHQHRRHHHRRHHHQGHIVADQLDHLLRRHLAVLHPIRHLRHVIVAAVVMVEVGVVEVVEVLVFRGRSPQLTRAVVADRNSRANGDD
jgi:hypothetical protein